MINQQEKDLLFKIPVSGSEPEMVKRSLEYSYSKTIKDFKSRLTVFYTGMKGCANNSFITNEFYATSNSEQNFKQNLTVITDLNTLHTIEKIIEVLPNGDLQYTRRGKTQHWNLEDKKWGAPVLDYKNEFIISRLRDFPVRSELKP